MAVGYTSSISVSTDNAIWHELAAKSPTLNRAGAVLDTTNTRDAGIGKPGEGVPSRAIGLNDWSYSGEVIWEDADTALGIVQNALLTRADIYVQYLPAGVVASGVQGKGVVESYNTTGAVDGIVMASISIQANGALAQAT